MVKLDTTNFDQEFQEAADRDFAVIDERFRLTADDSTMELLKRIFRTGYMMGGVFATDKIMELTKRDIVNNQ